MNRDGLYTVQAVSKADDTKHNVVVGVKESSGRFRDWWRLLKSGVTVRAYNVWWEEARFLEEHSWFRHVGTFQVVCSENSASPTGIHLYLGEEYKDIKYSLETFERFFIFKRERPDSFGVCVTVKV